MKNTQAKAVYEQQKEGALKTCSDIQAQIDILSKASLKLQAICGAYFPLLSSITTSIK